MTKITAIDFYRDQTSVCDDFQKELDLLGVVYNTLFYNSETHDHELVYAPLRTWNFVEGQFNATMPFVTFIEINSNEPDPRKWPLHFVTDLRLLRPWLT